MNQREKDFSDGNLGKATRATVMRKAGYRLSIFYAFVNCLGAYFSHHTHSLSSVFPPCFTFSRHLSCLCRADKTRNGQNGCHRPTVLSILIAFTVMFFCFRTTFYRIKIDILLLLQNGVAVSLHNAWYIWITQYIHLSLEHLRRLCNEYIKYDVPQRYNIF